ncbi:MAG: phosphatase [Erysipelotrichaceae bacterium]|nr:phosphatase [Erysipelotrichaceae bacterium]
MKNKLVVDIHTHTIASGHAYGTIRENALAASEKGLVGLGVSEHAPGLPDAPHPFYFNNIPAIPRELYGVHIYYGVENNVMNDGSLGLVPRFMRKLDYGIVGIHGTCYQDQGIEKNTDNLIKAMSDPKIFFVSHPDDGYYPLDYERVVLAAKELGVALEVNNSSVRGGWKKNCIENIHTYLELCMKYRTNIFVGSDAHDPSNIGHFDEAVALLDEVGFDEDLIINNSEEKFREFIHFKEL